MSLATNGLPSHLQTNGNDEIEYILTVSPKKPSELQVSPSRPTTRPPPSPTKSPSNSLAKSPRSPTKSPHSPTKSSTNSPTKSPNTPNRVSRRSSPRLTTPTLSAGLPRRSSATSLHLPSPSFGEAEENQDDGEPDKQQQQKTTPFTDEVLGPLPPHPHPQTLRSGNVPSITSTSTTMPTSERTSSPPPLTVDVRIANAGSLKKSAKISPKSPCHLPPPSPKQIRALTPSSSQQQQQQQQQSDIDRETTSLTEGINDDEVDSNLSGSFSLLKTNSISFENGDTTAAAAVNSVSLSEIPRPETPSSSSSSFQSVTPSSCATPLIGGGGGGTPVGMAFGRQRTASSDGGRRNDDEDCSESESDDDEDNDAVSRITTDENGRKVTMAQTDRFGFFVGSDQYSESNKVVKKISIDRMRKRERKWLDMTDNWERWMSKRFNKIKERCRKGIPPALRARAWSYLCGSKYMMEHHVGRYEKLLAMDHDPRWVDDITKDLHRQFPLHEMFATQGGWGQKNLFNVLIAYATHNPEVGYCQAMAPLAAVLLMHMPEEQAFWSLVSICDRYMPGYYSAGLEQVQVDGDVLYGLLKKSSNVTYKHLKKQRVDPILIMMEWFMCVFSRTLPWPSVLRVWDMFFCEGIKVLFRVALVLFKSVLGTSAQCAECPGLYETVEALKNIPPEVQAEDYLAAESLKISVDEKDMEREHKKQVKKRRKAKEAKEREMEMKKSGSEIKNGSKRLGKKKDS